MARGVEGQGQDSPTDEELLRRAVAGDEAAFGEFCSRSLPRLSNTFRHVCSIYHVPESLVEDAIQLAAIDTLTYIRNHNPSEISRGLLSVITRRTLYRMIRAERRRSTFHSTYPVDELKAPWPFSVEDVLIIREAFESLSNADRAILSAILFEAKSRDEVAQEFGLTSSAVSKRYYRAIFKLRVILGGIDS